MKRSRLVVGVVFIIGCGGGLAVGPTSPRPNLIIAKDRAPSQLVLGSAVQNDFRIPGGQSMSDVPVTGWRTTLENGFHAAFADSSGQRTLELVSAELSFAPAAAGVYGTTGVIATIRYKARLLEGTQEIAAVADSVGAHAMNTSPSPEGMTKNAGDAVEALYEKLNATLLKQ